MGSSKFLRLPAARPAIKIIANTVVGAGDRFFQILGGRPSFIAFYRLLEIAAGACVSIRLPA